MILFVGAEVLGELIDTGIQEGNLHFRRPRILLMNLILINEPFLLLASQGHDFFSSLT